MRIYKSFFRFEKCRKACKYRLYRLMRTYKEIVKNYILIYIKNDGFLPSAWNFVTSKSWRFASLRYSVASLLTYLVSRSIVATKRLSQETIFFRLSLCFFACCSSFPKSSAILFGSVADELLFGSFFTSLIILRLLLLTGQNVFSSLHETSIRRKLWRVAPCKSHPFHYSSKLDIIAKRQVVTCLFCLPVGFSSFPKSSAILFGSPILLLSGQMK